MRCHSTYARQSRRGIGVSVGAKGLRFGTGPRGHYIHAGRHGLYYRASLGSAGQRRQRTASEPIPAQVTFEMPAVNMIEFESGDVLLMRDGTSANCWTKSTRRPTSGGCLLFVDGSRLSSESFYW
ncbi:DUF4236 domain-containing protein [Rhizobium laguerreae]|uniref:DUF4236 domain-containing protein n=1 Tax=Rhizobium laguerreae TaxID=1076926 RepID=UPI0021B0A286|nr:DUF4236 domain-containing protein [Rhizobium laguerreae]